MGFPSVMPPSKSPNSQKKTKAIPVQNDALHIPDESEKENGGFLLDPTLTEIWENPSRSLTLRALAAKTTSISRKSQIEKIGSLG